MNYKKIYLTFVLHFSQMKNTLVDLLIHCRLWVSFHDIDEIHSSIMQFLFGKNKRKQALEETLVKEEFWRIYILFDLNCYCILLLGIRL